MTTTVTVENSVEYHLNLIGTIWLPAITCATTRKYSRDYTFATWSQKPNWDDPKAELEAIEQFLLTDIGDFQMLEDWQCTKLETETRLEPNFVMVKITRERVIRPWQHAGSEEKFIDCMYPSEE